MECENCGETEGRIIDSPKFGKKLCYACYQSFSQRGTGVHELPKFGETKTDPQGRYICHVCGRAFKKVLTHVWQRHGMNAYEYKERFGLYTSIGLCAEDTRDKLRLSVKDNFELVVKDNLLEGGVTTRFNKGHTGRVDISEQLRQALRARNPLHRKRGEKNAK